MGKPSPYESLPLLEFTHGRSLCGSTYSRACFYWKWLSLKRNLGTLDLKNYVWVEIVPSLRFTWKTLAEPRNLDFERHNMWKYRLFLKRNLGTLDLKNCVWVEIVPSQRFAWKTLAEPRNLDFERHNMWKYRLSLKRNLGTLDLKNYVWVEIVLS